jgi:abortive infection bacteriophage resistance protein
MLPFQKGGGGHNFNSGVTFEQIVDLYTFDRQLRVLLLDALERIEIAIKAALNNSVALQRGPHWFMNKSFFKPGCDHAFLLEGIKEEIGHGDPQKRTVSVAHYYKTYDDPEMPPSWMVLEAISFGKLAYIVRNLAAHELKAMSHAVCLADTLLASWCLSMSYLRNLCAHHSRVWNRVMTIKPAISSSLRLDMTPNDRAYAQLVVVQKFMQNVSPSSRWPSRLQALLNEHPKIDPKSLGFPSDWIDRPVWQ